MTSQTQTQKDRAERTVYVAIDAVQLLCDRGYGGNATDKAFEHLRELQRKIENIPVRGGKAGAK